MGYELVVPGFLVILLHIVAGWGRGWGQQGGYVKSKLQKPAYFTVVESLDVPSQQAHILPAALILPKESRE
jgi:hypothetical protein